MKNQTISAGGRVLAAVLFFIGAVVAAVGFIHPLPQWVVTFLGPVSRIPMGWMSPFFTQWRSSWSSGGLLFVFFWKYWGYTIYTATTLVLLACGILILTVGRKRIARTGFVIGILLIIMCLPSTLRGLLDAWHSGTGMGWDYVGVWGFWRVSCYLAYLAIAFIFMVAMGNRAEKSLRIWRIMLAIVMFVLVFVIWPVMLILIYGLPPMYIAHFFRTWTSDLYKENFANIPLFAALLVLAFWPKKEVGHPQQPDAIPPEDRPMLSEMG